MAAQLNFAPVIVRSGNVHFTAENPPLAFRKGIEIDGAGFDWTNLAATLHSLPEHGMPTLEVGVPEEFLQPISAC